MCNFSKLLVIFVKNICKSVQIVRKRNKKAPTNSRYREEKKKMDAEISKVIFKLRDDMHDISNKELEKRLKS